MWFQSVCPLMASLSAYCLPRVSLTLDMGFSSKAQLLLLTLEEGYLLKAAPPDLEGRVVPLGSSVPALPPLLGRGVVPLGSGP